VVTPNGLLVVISTSEYDGLYGRLVDCLCTSLSKFYNSPAPDAIKKLHVGKAGSEITFVTIRHDLPLPCSSCMTDVPPKTLIMQIMRTI